MEIVHGFQELVNEEPDAVPVESIRLLFEDL